MNIRAALKAVLLPACLEATQRMRSKVVEAELAQSDVLTERARWVYKELRLDFNDTAAELLTRCMIVLSHGKDGLMRVKSLKEVPGHPVLDPLTVVKFLTTIGLCLTGQTYIVVSGKNRTCLSRVGKLNTYKNSQDNTNDVAIATDLETEECIDRLTEAEIRYILTNTDVFAPVVSQLLASSDDPAPVEPRTTEGV